MEQFKVDVSSETDKLLSVIIHTPGHEIENMTPENVKRSLYSDILNLSVAAEEYLQLKGVLDKVTQTLEVRTLLTDILVDEKVKEQLVREICFRENVSEEIDGLLGESPETLASELIEGVVLKRDNLTRFLNKDRYSIQPLHNFLFTRDASMVLWDELVLGKMAARDRKREPLIMEAIYNEHPLFRINSYNPEKGIHNKHFFKNPTIEGGDLLVASQDVILVGTGVRTSSEGVDFLIELVKEKTRPTGSSGRETVPKHIIVQELPPQPESFIHLDMTFTFLDTDTCIIYEPLILKEPKCRTIHIIIDDGKVKGINEENNLLTALRRCGIDVSPILCGGKGDPWIMEREQWHSGANFLAIAPNKIIGYERNYHTLEELSKIGFEIIKAKDFTESSKTAEDYKKVVITIPGAELARGGGGARCLTMPLLREKVEW